MKKFKKGIMCVCVSCVLILSSIFGMTVCANTIDDPVLLYMGDSYIAAGDDYVAVPVRVENNKEGFFSITFDIIYNPQILTYKTCISKNFIITEGEEYENSASSRGKRMIVEYIGLLNYTQKNSDVMYLIFSIDGTIPYTGFTPVQVFDPIIGVGSTGYGKFDDCDVVFSCGESGVLSFCVVGDSNNDAFVNLKDVLLLRKIIADFDNLDYSFRASDMDGSLSIDLKDVLLLRKNIATAL